MKKIQKTLFFIALLCMTQTVQAQWQKVLGKSPVLELPISFSKYQSILCASGEQDIHYTKDNGKHWKTMRPTYFKAKDTLRVLETVINELGIFALIQRKYKRYNDSTFIFFTPDFGKTWKRQLVPLFTLDTSAHPPRLLQNKTHIYFYGDASFRTVILKYTKKLQSWEDVSSKYDKYPDFLKLTDAAEYLGDSRVLTINYTDGKTVNEFIKNDNSGSGNYAIIADSLLYRPYTDNWVTIRADFSRDFGRTWVPHSKSFPIPKGANATAYFFTYKNKLFVVSNAKIYSSLDKGINWVFESNEMEKHIGNSNPNLSIQDSVLCFNNELNGNIVFGYNIVTKKVTCHNEEQVRNDINDDYIAPANKVTKLPSGQLLLRCLQSQYVSYISSDKGTTWKVSSDYPYHLEKIVVDNNTFYIQEGYDYHNTSYYKPIVRFVNNIRKDTVSFFPSFTSMIRKGDTIVLANPTSTNDKLIYSTKPPFDKWTSVPNITNLSPNQLLSFENQQVLSFAPEYWNADKMTLINLDGSFSYIKNGGFKFMDASTTKSLWAANVGELANSNDLGKTWRTIKIPKPTSYITPYQFNRNSLLLINQKNIPLAQDLILIESKVPYISRDSGKIWRPFNNGLENDAPYKIQQIDDYLFATALHGLYRRPLSDINLRYISGKIFQDLNSNKIKNTNEPAFANVKITSKKSGAFAVSDTTGAYSFLMDVSGNDTLLVSFENKTAIFNPLFHIATKSDTATHFTVQFTPNIQDLKTDITALTPPRAGFNNTYILNVKNVGSVVKDCKLMLKYNAKQTFIQASIPTTSNVNQIITWNLDAFKPNSSKTIQVTFKTAQDAMIRSDVTAVAMIDPIATDNFKGDNVDSLKQIVVGSFDPNDKQVAFSNARTNLLNSKTPPSVIDQNTELTYTIRFQNTGNYPADFVRVVDTLSELLDVSTLRFLSASHEYKTSSTKGRAVVIDFNPIILPDSSANEAKSHGFIKFAIKPKRAVQLKEAIKNTAYIYFDYNPAIITNTVESKSIISSTQDPTNTEIITIYPNPSNRQISFAIKDCNSTVMKAQIYGTDGRLLLTKSVTDNYNNWLDISTFVAGVYVLRVQSNCGNYLGKFVVEK